MNFKLYKCKVCGQLFITLVDKGNTPVCCDLPMEEVVAVENDNKYSDKHVPVVCFKNKKVFIRVGKELHPSTESHYINYIILVTDKSTYIRELIPGDTPTINLSLTCKERVREVYSYCNIHGLYKYDLCFDNDEIEFNWEDID